MCRPDLDRGGGCPKICYRGWYFNYVTNECEHKSCGECAAYSAREQCAAMCIRDKGVFYFLNMSYVSIRGRLDCMTYQPCDIRCMTDTLLLIMGWEPPRHNQEEGFLGGGICWNLRGNPFFKKMIKLSCV